MEVFTNHNQTEGYDYSSNGVKVVIKQHGKLAEGMLSHVFTLGMIRLGKFDFFATVEAFTSFLVLLGLATTIVDLTIGQL